jgi:RNA polymerase sigma-70 factor (ECF subfamily)
MIVDPDAELVARVGRGDRAAAQVLMRRHLPKMLGLARRMLSDSVEAEDAVQDAFMRLWTHAARWQPGQAKFETWLYRVTLNKCFDRLRRKPAAPLDAARGVAYPAPAPNTNLQSSNHSRQIEDELQALPERQRAAIQLCHYQDCGNIEAAEIMGISVEALESLLSRGRRTLRTRLQQLKDE